MSRWWLCGCVSLFLLCVDMSALSCARIVYECKCIANACGYLCLCTWVYFLVFVRLHMLVRVFIGAFPCPYVYVLLHISTLANPDWVAPFPSAEEHTCLPLSSFRSHTFTALPTSQDRLPDGPEGAGGAALHVPQRRLPPRRDQRLGLPGLFRRCKDEAQNVCIIRWLDYLSLYWMKGVLEYLLLLFLKGVSISSSNH